jgi:hypothetical protein
VAISFIGERKQRTLRKPPTCHKSLIHTESENYRTVSENTHDFPPAVNGLTCAVSDPLVQYQPAEQLPVG